MSSIDTTGINLAQQRLDVISKNIANANTVGFKGSTFNQTLAAMSFASSGSSAAGGVQGFSQGTISSSSNPFNMAINGNGLFQLENNGIKTYTRDGQFSVNNVGEVVDVTGNILTGYLAVDGKIQNSTGAVALKFASEASKPVATTTATLGLTLNSLNSTINRVGTTTPLVAPVPFDLTNPATYTSSTTSNVYDSLGAPHTIETFYTKTGVDAAGVATWDVNATIDGVVPSGTSLIGALTFDASGKLTSSVDNAATASTPAGIAAVAAAADSILATNFMTSTAIASSAAAVTAAAAITSATSAARSVKNGALFSTVTNGTGGSAATVAAIKVSTEAAVNATTVGTADRAAATALKTLIDSVADAQADANVSTGNIALENGTSIMNAVIAATSIPLAASSVISNALASTTTNNSTGGSAATVAAIKVSTAAAVSATTTTVDRAAATALKILIDSVADAQASVNVSTGGIALDDGTSIMKAVIAATTAATTAGAVDAFTTTATAKTTAAAAAASATNVTASTIAATAMTTAATAAAAVVPQYTALSGVFSNALTVNATNGPAISLDLSKSVQYATSFGATNSQDGFPSGQMTSYTVGTDGTISVLYSTGNSAVVGQVALATFKNLNGLAAAPNNQWTATAASGNASVGTAGSTALGLGLLSSSAVEDSNVNLVNEMVNMIAAQRAFQAQSSVIKTEDQNLQTVVGLKQ